MNKYSWCRLRKIKPKKITRTQLYKNNKHKQLPKKMCETAAGRWEACHLLWEEGKCYKRLRSCPRTATSDYRGRHELSPCTATVARVRAVATREQRRPTHAAKGSRLALPQAASWEWLSHATRGGRLAQLEVVVSGNHGRPPRATTNGPSHFTRLCLTQPRSCALHSEEWRRERMG